MFIKKYKFNKAFSLAEILLTLVVIGFVANLTVPSLIQNINNQDIITKVKKNQSILDQAIKRYMAENGCIGNLSQCSAFVNDNDLAVWNEIKPYLMVIKECGLPGGKGCFAKDVTYKYLDGTALGEMDNFSGVKAVLSGTGSIRFIDGNGNCSSDQSISNNTPFRYVCGLVEIDVNGSRGPNQAGRDLFSWRITRNGVYPNGMYDDFYYGSAEKPLCNPSGGGRDGEGYGCTAKILKEGEINY